MRTTHRAAPLLLAVALLALGCSDGEVDEAAPTTTATSEPAGPPVALELEGPITGGVRGVPHNPMPAGFEEEYDYREDEFFVSGTATSYRASTPLSADGTWAVTPDTTADYTTRILVRQPADPADFNGVVLVEWLNVSAGRDSDPGFGLLYPEILGSGYGYIGVSAQETSIEGGGGILEVPGVPAEALVPLKEWDPERYAPLDHPGDDYSYDIFTQVGALAAGRAPTTPLAGLAVDTVIALGESQSAARLTSYVNGVHPLAATYDAFLIENPGSAGAPIREGSDESPRGLHIRTDLAEPVLRFATETDLTFLRFIEARQPDTDTIATWEVAGTAHADQSTLDYGVASARRWTDAQVDFRSLCGPANTGPQPEVARAALVRLRAWVEDGTPPPTGAPIESTEADELVRDADGNVLGGIRTPDVEAPIATNTGVGSANSVFCSLFGQETPFTSERLAELYPNHEAYVEQVTASADEAVEAGFLLEYDRDAIVEAAARSDVGG